jgi:hypothetical protein
MSTSFLWEIEFQFLYFLKEKCCSGNGGGGGNNKPGPKLCLTQFGASFVVTTTATAADYGTVSDGSC